MSTQVAGVLRDPFERPLGNTDIDIRAITNTFAVLPGATVKVTTSAQGEYNFILEPANYAVSVILDGRAVYQGAITITSTTPPGTLPQLLKQAEMLSELPLNYAEYFQQVQATVKDDADRAQAAADGIDDQVDEAREYAEQSQASAQSSQQSSQTAQQALADTQVIANKFQNLDDAVTETQKNAQQTQSDAAQTASDRAAADAAAQRAEDAAGSAETVNVRNVRVPPSETINALPVAAQRANSVAAFDSQGASTVKPLAELAQLDSSGKVPIGNIPSAAITEVFPVSSQAQMLALTADPGDVAKRVDLGRSYILMASPATQLSNWVVITDDILVTLGASDGYSYLGSVSSFADLRALIPTSAGKMVMLKGWNSGSFTGGGLFISSLSAATDDGGVVASSGGSYSWERVDKSRLNLFMFGATKTASDNTIAINNWLKYASANKCAVYHPGGDFKYSSPISLKTAGAFSLIGESAGTCSLTYNGTSTTPDLFTITSPTEVFDVMIKGILFSSLTDMTSGYALRMDKVSRVQLLDLSFDHIGGPRKMMNGVWLNDTQQAWFTKGELYVKGTGLTVNGRAGSDQHGADLWVDKVWAVSCNVGHNIAGGFGGFYIDNGGCFGCGTSLLFDNSKVQGGNREVFIGKQFVSDGAFNNALHLNDTLSTNAPILISGFLASSGQFGNGDSRGIYVQSWPNGTISISGAQLFNCKSDAISKGDASTFITIDASTYIRDNAGYGIYCANADPRVDCYAKMFNNTRGDTFNVTGDGVWQNMAAPSSSPATGGFSAAVTSMRFKKDRKTLHFKCEIAVSNNGNGSNSIFVNLPFQPSASSGYFSASGRNISTDKSLSGYANSASSMKVTYFDGTYPVASGQTLVINGMYEI